MGDLKEYLPIIIPLAIVEILLLVVSYVHILRHKTYKRGNRALWLLVSLITILGPVLYFAIGKEDA
ncbi:MAG: PLDc N-terminal domain-containing protein [Eubacterium sp.]|nr:PLDc N-terminal domain-containing protein [Eubacterium sp.]SEF55241.1 Phospholipase_D-nuclease N-terminal [Eubacterium ruminantium]